MRTAEELNLDLSWKDIRRIWKTVDKVGRSSKECWPLFSLPQVGRYRSLRIKGGRYPIHRLIYFIVFGKIAAGKVIRHKCDNTGCGNPNHLRKGSQKDNVRDCIKRGRRDTHIPELRKGHRKWMRRIVKKYGGLNEFFQFKSDMKRLKHAKKKTK